MNIWKLEIWKKYYGLNCKTVRSGVRLRFDKSIDPEVKRSCKDFIKWLRQQYVFPIRVPVYIKSQERIKANDGELVSATCFLPYSLYVEPYIRIAAGDYQYRKQLYGQDNALAGILGSIIHELTHYYQWINDMELDDDVSEDQALKHVALILDDYHGVRSHP